MCLKNLTLSAPPLSCMQSQNTLVKLAKETGDFELIELKDKLAISLQMCDQYTYDNAFVYFQPGEYDPISHRMCFSALYFIYIDNIDKIKRRTSSGQKLSLPGLNAKIAQFSRVPTLSTLQGTERSS